MAEPLRTGVIGVGAMGANHARVLAGLPDADLVAVADPDEARLRAFAGGPVRAYADYHIMLAEERLDAVVVAVPTRLHADVALACIERGVAVLVEKPLAGTLDDAERLRAASEAAGTLLAVGHVERCNPAVREVKRRLDQGAVGLVVQLRARRVGPFFQRERDVGVVHDLATHDIDVLRYLLDSDVERVQAETQAGLRTEHEDALSALLRFEQGAIAMLEVSWLAPVKVRELAVLGERGMITADYLSQEVRLQPVDGTAESLTLPGAGEAPLREELSVFLRAARGLGPPAVTAADGIAAIRVADALVESARRGEIVRVGGAGGST